MEQNSINEANGLEGSTETSQGKKMSWNEKYGKKKKVKKGTKVIIFVIIALVLVGGGAAVYGYSKVMKKAMDSLGDETLVESYGKRDMTTYINSTAKVESQNVHLVTTTLSYPVKEIKVEVGDKVKAGDVVCIIDDEDINDRIDALEEQASDEERRQAKEKEIADRQLQQSRDASGYNVEKALDSVSEAKAELDAAKEEYEAAKNIYEIAQEEKEAGESIDDMNTSVDATVAEYKAEYETAKAKKQEKEAAYEAALKSYDNTVEGSKESIQSAENSNELTTSNLSSYSAVTNELASYYKMKGKTVILAGQDGIVTEINAQEGLPAGGAILKIEDDSKLRVETDVKEKDIFKLKEGQDVELENSSLEDVSGKGKISKVVMFSSESNEQLASAASGNSATSYKAIVDIDSFENMLLGMKVKVKIATGTEISVNAVPYTAILSDDDDSEYVYVAVDTGSAGMHMVKRKNIETGESGDYYTEVTGGELEEGDKVILFPEKVMEDSVVKVKE